VTPLDPASARSLPDRARDALLLLFALGLGFSISLSEITLGLLTALWLWRLRDAESRRRVPPLVGAVAAFAAVTVVSALASGHAAASLRSGRDLWLVVALFVVADALADARAADRFLSVLAVVVAAAGLMGLVQVGLCPTPEPSGGLARWFFHRCDRARGAFSIYMTLAGVTNALLLATLPRLLPGPAFRGWAVPVWLVTLGGLAATLTRGAWVGFVAGAASLVPTTRRGRWLFAAGLLALGLAALAGPAALRHRVLSIGDPADPTVREREYMWRSGFAMWREHPWLGWGPGGVKRAYRAFALPEAVKQRTGHVHNSPLQILVERGVIGLAAWVALWVAFYARAIACWRRLPARARRERALVAGGIAAVTGFLVGGLAEYNFGDAEVAVAIWAVMALPFVAARESGGGPAG